MKIIQVSVDAPEIARRLGFEGAMKRRSKKMIKDIAQIGKETIRQEITDVGIKRKSGSLINAVQAEAIDDTTAEVFMDLHKAPYAPYLNYGYSPFDLKPGLLAGKSGKISVKGSRYARIPLNKGKDFRTVSEKQPARRWHHPGYSGRLYWEQGTEIAYYKILEYVEDSFTELLEGV